VFMLPEPVGCHLASLCPGQARPALRVEVTLDPTGNVLDASLRRCFVRLEHRLTYDAVDAVLAGETAGVDLDEIEALRVLSDLALAREKYRAAQRAPEFTRREVSVRVRDGEIEVKVIDRESVARRTVAEFMILANSVAAELAKKQGLPILYRVQDPPTEPRPSEDASYSERLEWRRSFGQTRLSLEPGVHIGVGVPTYTQLTSPLRRYADMVMARQLIACVEERPPVYSAEEMLTILANVEETIKVCGAIEREAERFWLIEYFRRHEAEGTHAAQVVEPLARGYRIELLEWGVYARLVTGLELRPGQIVDVRFATLTPEDGTIIASLVSDSAG